MSLDDRVIIFGTTLETTDPTIGVYNGNWYSIGKLKSKRYCCYGAVEQAGIVMIVGGRDPQ